jgi:hypothetical protein
LGGLLLKVDGVLALPVIALDDAGITDVTDLTVGLSFVNNLTASVYFGDLVYGELDVMDYQQRHTGDVTIDGTTLTFVRGVLTGVAP